MQPAPGGRTFSFFSVNPETAGTELNGQPFQVVGLRTSNALISDSATQELIDNMDVFAGYGINTFSVFFQGSRFGAVKGYNEDTSLNPTYAARMKRIIEAADARGMVILVGCLYYNAGTLATWPSWGQAQANQAIANTVEWLVDNNFRNVFIDVDNEGQAVEHMGWNAEQLVAAGKAVDSSYVIGISGPRGTAPPKNADLALRFTTRVSGKPYIESEGVPNGYFEWGRSCGRTDNYCNVGVYADSLKEDWLRFTTEHLKRGDGYMGASSWLQAVPPLGPNHRPGGDGTADDPGIKFWLEHVDGLVAGDKATPTPVVPAVERLVLVDADTEQDIAELVDGATLDLATLPTRNLNVRAETVPATVGSVRFGLDGNANYRTESGAPYALAGESDGNYNAWTPAVGSHTLTATPYSGAFATGTAGTALSVAFTVVDGGAPSTPIPPTTATATPSETPDQPTATATFTPSPSATATATPSATPDLPTATLAPPTPTPTPVVPAVVRFVLVNADTEQDIGELTAGATLDLATLPTRNLNVRAETTPATVGSVRFGLDGNANYRTENGAPYALAGNGAENYLRWTPAVGAHVLTATPYSGRAGTGTAGLGLTVVFTVIDRPYTV